MTTRATLPADHASVAMVCGCAGTVIRTCVAHGGSIHIRVKAPCGNGHPERLSTGVIGHFRVEAWRR